MLDAATLNSKSKAPDFVLDSCQLSLRVPLPPATEGRGHARAQGREGIESRARALIAMERGAWGNETIESRIETNRIMARAHGDREWELRAIAALGLLHLKDGRMEEGAWAFEDARRLSTLPLDRAFCLYGGAWARIAAVRPGEILGACSRALRIVRAGDTILRSRLLLLASEAYLASGDHVRARRACDRTREIPGLLEMPERNAFLRLAESDLLRATGRLDAAAIACGEAFESLSGPTGSHFSPCDPSMASIHRRLGEILFDLGRLDEARAKAMEGVEADPSRAELGRLLALASRCDLEEGAEEEGFKGLMAAEDALRCAGVRRDLAHVLLRSGEARALREANGAARDAAREGIFEARSIFRSLDAPDLVSRCDVILEMLRPRANGKGTVASESVSPRPPRVPCARRMTQLGFLTSDPGILAALEPLESLARTSMPVLILGESGTGKEVLARALHRAAGGRGPFVAVNCGALPSELQESELFGHVRGAFTGAIADRIGLFEAADGGILLLDEIGEMTPRAQVKLLRILELGEVRRVGETRTRRVHARVVAATNSDLLANLRAGTFRLDLYYRLCALRIWIPPLRERLGDVPLLAQHFTRLFTPAGESTPALSPEALDLLMGHPWPGNVRELRFTIERAIALTRALDRRRVESDCITIEPTTMSAPPPPPPTTTNDVAVSGGLEAYIENTERRLILRALEENGWNRTRAAKSLGAMSRTTLIGKMKRLGLFPHPDQANAEGDE